MQRTYYGKVSGPPCGGLALRTQLIRSRAFAGRHVEFTAPLLGNSDSGKHAV